MGSGQLAKMANQICSAGIVQGLAEGIRFAQLAGLDIDALLAAMSVGASTSWHLNNTANTMSEGRFDFGFAVDLVRKDLGLCLEEAARLGASLPTTVLIDPFFADLQRAGSARSDCRASCGCSGLRPDLVACNPVGDQPKAASCSTGGRDNTIGILRIRS